MDAHILMDDHLTLLEAHTFTEALEDQIRMALPNAEITLHTEPYLAERKHQAEAHGGAAPTMVETRRLKR